MNAELSINLRGITSRLVWGCIASVLFSVIHMFIHPSGAGYFMVPFYDSVMAYGFVGVAGFFARNTVRTFNAVHHQQH